MIVINSSTNINQPAEQVFDFVTKQGNAELWLSGWLETRPTSEDIGVGSTWIDVVEVLGRRIESEYQLTELEPGRMIAFKSISGTLPISGVYTFTPAGDSTDVIFHLESESSGFFRLADPLVNRIMQRQWDANLANIKDLLETASP
jgi:uncharacterized membrane protein